MEINKIENMLKKTGKQTKPDKWFAVKMRFKLYFKRIALNLQKFSGRASDSRFDFKLRFASVLTAFVLAASSGVGVYAYSSPNVNENSPLYPIKLGLEKVEAFTAITPAQKANFQRKRALRRIAEIEVLSTQLRQNGKPEVALHLDNTLEKAKSAVEASLAETENVETPTEATTSIEATKKDLTDMSERLVTISEREDLKKFKDLRERVNEVEKFTMRKLDNANKAGHEIKKEFKKEAVQKILRNRLRSDEDAKPVLIPSFRERLKNRLEERNQMTQRDSD